MMTLPSRSCFFNGRKNAMQLFLKVYSNQAIHVLLTEYRTYIAFYCFRKAVPSASSGKSLSCLSAIRLHWSLTLDSVIPVHC